MTCSNCSICFVKVRKSIVTVWVLRDYESGSWQNNLKVRVIALGLRERNVHVIGFGIMKDNILVFSTEQNIYSRGLDEETFMMV